VAIRDRFWQIDKTRFRNSLAGSTVTIHEHLDDTVSIRYGPHVVGRYSSTGENLISTTPKERGGKGGSMEAGENQEQVFTGQSPDPTAVFARLIFVGKQTAKCTYSGDTAGSAHFSGPAVAKCIPTSAIAPSMSMVSTWAAGQASAQDQEPSVCRPAARGTETKARRATR
jgi:hypothetical protein